MAERAGRGDPRVLDQRRPTHKPCSPLWEISLGPAGPDLPDRVAIWYNPKASAIVCLVDMWWILRPAAQGFPEPEPLSQSLAHARSRLCAVDPDPEEHGATASFSNILSPLLVAFPKLLAPKLLQWCNTSDTFHFSSAVLAQFFGNSELPTSRCCPSRMLQDIPPRDLQDWLAWLSRRMVPNIPAGARRGGFQRGQSPCA